MLLVGPPILRQCITLSLPSPPPKPPLTVPQNPCTQLFFGVDSTTAPKDLLDLLEKAWHYDALTTLRLILYLRTLKGGKSRDCNDGFCVAAVWLYEKHPLTLSCNLREFASFGSIRDFSEVVFRVVNGADGVAERKMDETGIARRAVSKYVKDASYRFLHERVSDLFADLLKSDIRSLKSSSVDLLSNASVECPSVGSSIDRHTLLCETIAKKVFPQDSDPSYLEIRDDHYVYRVRNRLKKEVLGPLRTAVKENPTEEQGPAKDYTLDFLKKAYQKLLKMKSNVSQKDYYQIYLAMILKDNYRLFPGMPASVIASMDENNIPAKELQWKEMVQGFAKQGKLANSLAVCDVSDNMSETAKNVSVSMALLISELSDGPWKETVYGFNRSPKQQKIEGGDLYSKVNLMKQLKGSDRVNIEAILIEILQVAVREQISSEKMVKRVFIFTNKDFRKGVNNCWGWNYSNVWAKYKKAGFDCVPEVVFWKIDGLNYSPPIIRQVSDNRVTIINGFSRSMFAFFLNEDAIWRSDEIKSVTAAEDVMQITLSGKEYQNLAVLD